ncbi:hypothetical protein V8C42DRAFT_320554, partial [Trichoderma barbatum]
MIRPRGTKYIGILISISTRPQPDNELLEMLRLRREALCLQRQKADTKRHPYRTCLRLIFWQLGLRACLLPKLRKHLFAAISRAMATSDKDMHFGN